MHGLRRNAVYVLSVAAFSICACATTTQRLSEDLQKNGFTISYYNDGETATGPTVTVANVESTEEMARWSTTTVTDAESTERLLQWFRHRPRASSDFATAIVQQALAQSLKEFSLTIRIETTRLRVKIPMLPVLPVVLETRDTPAGGWNKASWIMRPEDAELRDWALSQVKENYKGILQESGLLDDDSESQLSTEEVTP